VQVRFEEFSYDGEGRELRRGDTIVPLSPKCFDLLGALIETAPRPLSKAALHDRLWPKTFVSEATLHSLVAELRKGLGDEPRKPRFVRTAHRFGYAFIGRVLPNAAALPGVRVACRLIWGLREMVLLDGENVLGRSHEANIFIDSEKVSRRHARIWLVDGQATLDDLGSKNGTRLRGERLTQRAPLVDGDEIRLGPVRLVFRRYLIQGTTRTDSG